MKTSLLKPGLLIAMLWSAIFAGAYDFESDGIYYNITSMSDLEVEVTYLRGVNYSGNITIPATVNYSNRTYTVTSIGDEAFCGDVNLSGVSLPNTIKKIGKSAFSDCRSLSSIRLPDGLTEISRRAFDSTGISSVILPASVSTIYDEAFRYSGNLIEVFFTSINKPSIGSSVFYGCHKYIEHYVPSRENYGFGKEYLSFTNNSYTYTGRTHQIEWTNNLKAYRCEIAESESSTEVNAGSYSKVLTATYSNGVDLSVEIPYEYTIKKVPMTLYVKDCQREYGESNPAFSCNIEGFVNGENEQSIGSTPTFECEANQNSNAGTYRILASLNAQNYEITYKYGTLTILPAPITGSVVNCTKIYGEKNPQFELTFSGLKNGETVPNWTVNPTFTTTANQQSNVGTYDVSATGGQCKNYTITSCSPGILTITKKDLTVKANNCEKLYGEENPTFLISYIGFVNGDNETSFSVQPTAECSADKNSDAGTYSITVSGGGAQNYNFIYQDGILTIRPLTVGFKDAYNTVTYLDMTQSTSDSYFNYIPEIIGPFSADDFWIEMWFLDKDNVYDDHVHEINISGGDYAGSYVHTNSDRTTFAGKYIFELLSKNNNPNVVANPKRAYVTVNRTSNNLEWNVSSPITVAIGEKIDLGIDYQADLWCQFHTDYDEELIEVSSENATSLNPHWYATGLKEGETKLYFNITCRKNDFGFYNFSDSSRLLYKNIRVIPSAGVEGVNTESNSISISAENGTIRIANKPKTSIVRIFSLQGHLVKETYLNSIEGLSPNLYIVSVDGKSKKIKL